MTSSRLLIYEPLCGGHRPDFVRYLAEELRRSPYRGTVRFVLGRGFLDSEPELRALLSRLAPAVEVMDAPEPADRPASLLKAISDFRPDCVLLFELTKWENFLCRHRLPCDLAGILFVQYPEIEWRKGRGVDRIIRFARRRVKELKLSLWLRRQSVRAVFLLNGERAAAVLNRRFPGRPVFHAVPDPAPSEGVSGCSEAASGRAGVGDAGVSDPGYRAPVLSGSAVAGLAEAGCSTAGRPIRFLLPGALSRRKGVFRMVEALHRVEPETARKAEFRFLGKAAVRDRVAFANALLRLRRRRPDVRVSFDDRAVPEQELREAMADADWILMPYLRPEYSSGILARAVAAGTPALGPAEGLIGRLILESGLGRVTRMDPVSLGRSLDEAAAAPGRIEESRRATFLDRSRPDVFAKSLLRAGWLDG